MNPRSRTVRTAAVAVVTAVVLVSGCAQQADTRADTRTEAGAVEAAQPARPARSPAAEAAARSAAAPTAVAPERAPTEDEGIPVEHPATTLPPGDPGPGAPSVPNPGRPMRDDEHDERARTVVPVEAMFDRQAVSGVLGGDWAQSASEPLACLADSGWVAQRSVAFDAADGRLLQTVATHRGHEAADRAVQEQLASLRACGWASERAPRMGTASAAASYPDGAESAVIVAAEGVTVTLVGSGRATESHRRWMSLLDLALGSSCAAAPDVCHDDQSASE
jgi:hypothetical protein